MHALTNGLILLAALSWTAPARGQLARAAVGPRPPVNALAARGVALADLNGDGAMDAFVVNVRGPSGEGDRVYFGDGHGGFADSGLRLTDPANWDSRPALGDIDGDGDIDALTGETVWLNDARGGFTRATGRIGIATGEHVTTLALADLDGDGSLDIFATVGWEGIRVYLNDGRGLFRDSGQRLGSGIVGPIALADLDGDGSIDAVTAGWRRDPGDPCPNHVWLNDGKGHFRDAGQPLDEELRHVHGLAVGDVNGDGRPDIVMGLTAAGRPGTVYLNEGAGRFRDGGQVLGNGWTHAVALADFDGDGSLDVFLACGDPERGSPNEIWLNDGEGHFRDSGRELGHAFSSDVALGDLDGDGRMDAFVVSLRLVDGKANPAVFGGAPAEIWIHPLTS